jgi:peptidoglycan/xylan/chitin deacetylase (PgdA/CDA1 family)
MKNERAILLSFDVEEFDMPLEYGQLMSADEQLRVGHESVPAIADMLRQYNATATFFTTANFAFHFPGTIKSLVRDHEIGSHTLYHSSFEAHHLARSKQLLENITGRTVSGLRMPRMRMLGQEEILNAGYQYDASLNPVWLPGRYYHLDKPRRAYLDGQLVRIPASASRFLRIPLFWLSFKNLPYTYYRQLVLGALRRDGYVSLYFHPWEFTDLSRYRVPFYAKTPSGELLLNRLDRLVRELGKEGNFMQMAHFAAGYYQFAGS